MVPEGRAGAILSHLRSHRLAGYAMVLILIIGTVEVIASVLFYEAIDRQALREDHARRVAELLVVSDRVHRLAPGDTAATMTTHHLDAATATAPAIVRSGAADEITEIHDHILRWEPELARRSLALDVERGSDGGRDLVGSMRLGDGIWLNFRSRDLSTGWPIVLRATAMTLLITVICLAIGFYALRLLTEPLRRLSAAAAEMGHGHMVRLREAGPSDLRELARSFNDMQARIEGLTDDQARTFEAISHDLRTPLSRLKLASDFVAEGEVAKIVSSSADEMEAMLRSLQRFLYAQHLECDPEPVDLTAATRDLLAPFGERAKLKAPARVEVTTWREPLLLALQPLVENALHYGNRADLRIASAGEDWTIEIADDGPGIPEDCFEKILDPFFRLDSARARDTAGFGLGIPTAHRLLERFGGKLEFRNGTMGGLIARVTVPRG
ncbi:MAG: HAMP domain-containing protein [Sphingomonadales bacterium]|nr:MAG: HAMP domain-containing protein [Alphaproteobacteria bacterium]TNF01803.1 MAG: HAMP domain-containing protein [Sphingomonadales bacterium]